MKTDEHDDCDMGNETSIGPEIEPGVRVATRHGEDHEVRHVVMRPIRDGEPIPPEAEIVRFGERTARGTYSTTTLYRHGKAAGDGPAQVATPRYRENYDRIFGTKAKVGIS
jgi:hypothetical protein